MYRFESKQFTNCPAQRAAMRRWRSASERAFLASIAAGEISHKHRPHRTLARDIATNQHTQAVKINPDFCNENN